MFFIAETSRSAAPEDKIPTEVIADGASLIAVEMDGVHKSDAAADNILEARHDGQNNSHPGTPSITMNLSIGVGNGRSGVAGDHGGISNCSEQRSHSAR